MMLYGDAHHYLHMRWDHTALALCQCYVTLRPPQQYREEVCFALDFPFGITSQTAQLVVSENEQSLTLTRSVWRFSKPCCVPKAFAACLRGLLGHIRAPRRFIGHLASSSLHNRCENNLMFRTRGCSVCFFWCFFCDVASGVSACFIDSELAENQTPLLLAAWGTLWKHPPLVSPIFELQLNWSVWNWRGIEREGRRGCRKRKSILRAGEVTYVN